MNSSNGGHRHFHGTHYVVSEDIDILVSRWCSKVNLSSPDKDFYVGLRSKMKGFLQDIFARVTFVSSQEIREGLLASIAVHKQDGLTVVSLERAYIEDGEIDGRIELTRTVDGDGRDIVIRSVRNNTIRKCLQFEQFRDKKIALIDDVVFTGGTTIETIKELHKVHANVHAITAAIGKKEGVDYIKRSTFGVIGQPSPLVVDCLKEFDDIMDQVCERDFYPGVPYSGREHFGVDLAAFPYLLPFGKPDEWASIPGKETKQFSCLCIDNAVALFEEIERVNGITVTCSMIPRPVFGSPKDGTRFVTFLKEKREQCLKV